jgi:hypothetical protein
MRIVKSVTAAAVLALCSASSFAQSYGTPVYGPHYAYGANSYSTSRIDQRQARQQERINMALRRGEISPHEAARLQEEQRRIRRAERHAAADGWISPQESARIERMQDRASENIRYAALDRRHFR